MPFFTKFFSYALQPKTSGQKLLCSIWRTLCRYFDFFLIIRGTNRRLSITFVKFFVHVEDFGVKESSATSSAP